jgi:large subunit ribosomal protein L7Ae
MKPDDILEIIEIARETGKIRKGINEATKAVERGVAKAIVVAEDVDPPEIIMHLQPLCDEKKALLLKVPSKNELGRAAGIDVSTAAVAIMDAGEAKKKLGDLGK